MSETDATLVLAALNGDARAFGELYDKYAALVRAICHDNTHDLGQAQDLAQEVFLRAHEKLNKLKKPDRFGAWLVSMARNVCREYRRGKLRDRHVLVGLDPEGVRQPKASKEDERLEHLREAIGKLGERERLALQVYYLQNEDAEQAQVILGISRSGLYRLLARARKKLEKIINDRTE